MDSDEETALAAIIIATFTENVKGKKGVKKKEWVSTETRHSRDILLLSNILLSVLDFFSFI